MRIPDKQKALYPCEDSVIVGELQSEASLTAKSSSAFVGDNAVSDRLKSNGRAQARRIVEFLKICTGCGADAVERHHKDSNPTNNSPENIVGLCQICHQLAHGKRKEAYSSSWAWRNPYPGDVA